MEGPLEFGMQPPRKRAATVAGRVARRCHAARFFSRINGTTGKRPREVEIAQKESAEMTSWRSLVLRPR